MLKRLKPWQRLMGAILLLLTHPTFASSLWVDAWSASPTDGAALYSLPPGSVFRETISPNLGGNTMRLHLSNRYGMSSIKLAKVSIGIKSVGASNLLNSTQLLKFNGSDAVIIPAGGEVISDPLSFTIKQFTPLNISFMAASWIISPTEHSLATEIPYFSMTANAESDSGVGFIPQKTLAGQMSWLLIERLEVSNTMAGYNVMAVGDSISDGASNMLCQLVINPDLNCLSIGQNARYTDFLARRLANAGHTNIGVVNGAISGNQIGQDAPWLSLQSGKSLLNRLDADVLKHNGVSKVILLEGINDLQIASTPNPNKVIQDLTTVINRLHAANIKVILGTLTPTQGTPNVPLAILSLVLHYGSDAVNTARQQVNAWIRSQSIADGVVDFDYCLKNPQKPSQLLPAYDSGDHLHLSVLGRQAMAQCVNLNLLTAP